MKNPAHQMNDRRVFACSLLLLILVYCISGTNKAAPAYGDNFEGSPDDRPAVEGCESSTFEVIKPSVWDCIKEGLEQENISVPPGDSGELSGFGVTADFSLNRDTQTLVITVKSRPSSISCAQIKERIGGVITDCRGATTLLVRREGNVEVWKILDPEVKQPETSYPRIRLNPGDSVSIEANGCVQTGGAGRTWKRYVDPQGSNSDRLYHGLVKLPGMNAFMRISDFIATIRNYRVPSDAGENLPVQLGYEDDNYSDNGYWGHDDGTGDQCRGVENAQVTLTIVRAGGQ